jgi:hypothetical protein
MSDDTTKTSAPAATETPTASAPPETAATATEASPSIPSPSDPNAPIPRTLEAIRISYTNCCARLGQLVYNLGIGEKEKADLLEAIGTFAMEEHNLPASMKKESPNLRPVPPVPTA